MATVAAADHAKVSRGPINRFVAEIFLMNRIVSAYIRPNRILVSIFTAFVIVTANTAHSQWTPGRCKECEVTGNLSSECGGPTISNAYGPYDYTNPRHKAEKLPIVDGAHFSTKVESLKGGINATLAGSDIDYTLRAFPNHHRALDAMGRYHLSYPNTIKPPNANYSADCYFQRAIVFRPEDGISRMVYGIFLLRSGRLDEAEIHYKDALELIPGSPELHNNLSLLYILKKDFEAARTHAREAYRLGFPLMGAKNKLVRLGEWHGDEEDGLE